MISDLGKMNSRLIPHTTARIGGARGTQVARREVPWAPLAFWFLQNLLCPGSGVLGKSVGPRSLRAKNHPILLLIASGRGVAVLPDWVVRELRGSNDYVVRPLTETGLTKRLYAAIREDDADKPYMAHLIKLAREIPVRLQRRKVTASAQVQAP